MKLKCIICAILALSFARLALAAKKYTPPSELNIHLVGVHPEKDAPMHQPVAHHFCHQVNPDFAQCVLYDGDKKDANLMGIEYIISEKVYETLENDEKKYWHPHNYEILSGALSAPGLPEKVEKEALKGKMNSYGKTWHVWRTPKCCGGGGPLPLGEPTLQWSLNHDGEGRPDTWLKVKASGVDVDKKRKDRVDLAEIAKPQGGVNTMRKLFEKMDGVKVQELKGVVDKEDAVK